MMESDTAVSIPLTPVGVGPVGVGIEQPIWFDVLV